MTNRQRGGNSSKTVDFSPDIYARILVFLVRWRSRVPGWRLETMGRLVTSEMEGIALIEGAMPKLSDNRLRKIFNKHLSDEKRHAEIFTDRFNQLKQDANEPQRIPPPLTPQGKRFNLLELVAYLEVQEARAIPLLEVYVDLYKGDKASIDAIQSAIKDERFHATWTHLQLERWIKEGFAEEVQNARVEAKALDRKSFWIQLFAMLRVVPKLLACGYFPPFFQHTASPNIGVRSRA